MGRLGNLPLSIYLRSIHSRNITYFHWSVLQMPGIPVTGGPSTNEAYLGHGRLILYLSILFSMRKLANPHFLWAATPENRWSTCNKCTWQPRTVSLSFCCTQAVYGGILVIIPSAGGWLFNFPFPKCLCTQYAVLNNGYIHFQRTGTQIWQ